MNGTLARATDAEYIIKIAWTGSQSNIAGQDSWVARVVVIDKTVFACMDSLIWGLINLLIPDVHTLQEKLMIMTEWNLGQNVWFLKAKTICLMWHNSVKKKEITFVIFQIKFPQCTYYYFLVPWGLGLEYRSSVPVACRRMWLKRTALRTRP